MNTVLLRQGFALRCYETRLEMGEAAAADVKAAILGLLKEKPLISMVFAAAPSQNEFLEAFVQDPAIDFSRIIAFHMDEYIALPTKAPQRFGNFLAARLFDRAPFHAVHYLDGNAEPQAECARYTALLREYPPDIVCLGIGENGHIAFNDPHVADFDDPQWVKPVALDEACRHQQVHDGCFPALSAVPTHALTLTIPALTGAAYHFCVVPAATKAEAVKRTVLGPVDPSCPASILRCCRACTLYTDRQSGRFLLERVRP